MSHQKPLKRPPIVEVEWVDSMGYAGWGARSARIVDLEKVDDLDHVSVGFLLKRTAKYVAINQSFGRTGSIDNCIQIPRCAVRSIKVLKQVSG